MTISPIRSATSRTRASDHSTLECELIRLTDALLAAVAADEAHEPPLADLVAFLHDEVLPHMEAEEEMLHGSSSDAPTALLVRAVATQRRRLTDLTGEVGAARTGIDAVRAASAVVALFMAVADAESSVLLPALASAAAPSPALAAPPAATPVPAVTGPASATAPRRLALDLRGGDYESCRRELSDAVHSLWRGDTLTITSGPELLALRIELEAHLPSGYRWSLPVGTPERSTTTVERL